MLEQGVDRTVLRAQMGHCSEAMTQRYAGIRADQKQAAVEGLIEQVSQATSGASGKGRGRVREGFTGKKLKKPPDSGGFWWWVILDLNQ